MAPELIKGGREYNVKVDIWSFGIFAMELADGDPPYINETQQRVVYNILKKNPPPIKGKWSNDFADFVKQAVTKDPEQRPSAEELLQHKFLQVAEKHQQEWADLVKTFCVMKQ